jgi:hypothetical protein
MLSTNIDIGIWFFLDMAKDRKAIYGTGAGGWFQNKGEKRSSSC